MAATSDREMEMLLSSFDQIYQVRAIIPQSVCSSFISVSSLPLSREKNSESLSYMKALSANCGFFHCCTEIRLEFYELELITRSSGAG